MAKEIKSVEVTVLKNKRGVFQRVTKAAWVSAEKHFRSEGWAEASDKEKEEFFQGKIIAKNEPTETDKPKQAKKSTKKGTPKNVTIKDAEPNESAEHTKDD